jgi:chemotaxis protein methyltransferase CheR
LQKFVPLLHPDGLLFAGHSESFHHAANLFRPRGKTVYEGVAGIHAAGS